MCRAASKRLLSHEHATNVLRSSANMRGLRRFAGTQGCSRALCFAQRIDLHGGRSHADDGIVRGRSAPNANARVVCACAANRTLDACVEVAQMDARSTAMRAEKAKRCASALAKCARTRHTVASVHGVMQLEAKRTGVTQFAQARLHSRPIEPTRRRCARHTVGAP